MSLDFYLQEERIVNVFEVNITHNLIKMADYAGLYNLMWRPEENGYEEAKDLIDPLEEGIARLKENPKHFEQFNPINGWGSYEVLLKAAERILEACKENPEAGIRSSR